MSSGEAPTNVVPLRPFGARNPQRYGLTDGELRREAERLLADGWSIAEIHAALELPDSVND